MRLILARGSRRAHLLMGAYLSGIVLAITAIVLADGTRFRFVPDPNIILATIGLVVGIALAVGARLERAWVPFLIVPLGVLATLASLLYHVANNPVQPGACAILYDSNGFPLAWSSTYNLLGTRCLQLLYPLYRFPNPMRNGIFFLLDVVFYVAVGIAIIQLSRGVIGKTITAQSFRGNNMI